MSPKKKTKAEIAFTVFARPVPKPRMTRRDKWIMRKRVKTQADHARIKILKNYWSWTDAVKIYYLMARSKTKNLQNNMFTKCRMGFDFHVPGNPGGDMDNYIKGVKDALKGLAYADDNSRIITGYDSSSIQSCCNECSERVKITKGKNKGQFRENCGKVRDCQKGGAVISIKGIIGRN